MSRADAQLDPSECSGARRTVLITGASTGIGRKVTERLAAAGHRVYAGARTERDLRSLGAIENVSAVRLDVTDRQDICAAVERITCDGRGLYGLVNNAGVATAGLVVEGDARELELTMAVNAIAPYHLTRAFAALIRASRGRIVMIGSIAGILAESGLSAYSMSKHALEALADALASEMERYGVQVSIIEPGGFRTELVSNMQAHLGVQTRLASLSAYLEPDAVAAAASLALFQPKPQRRYLVVTNAEEARITIAKQIEQLVQLNQRHAYTCSRDVLVQMLDAALLRQDETARPPLLNTLDHARFNCDT